jgi:hypothetical protein
VYVRGVWQLLLPKWNCEMLQYLFRLAVDIITVKPPFEFSLRSSGFEHETNKNIT